jgi:hypothetical protein
MSPNPKIQGERAGGRVLLRCGGSGMLEVATWTLDQIAMANSWNATTTRRLAGSSAASS